MKETTPANDEPSDEEIFADLNSDPKMRSLLRRLAKVSRDRDSECITADQAEEKIDSLGQQLKLAALERWARNAAASQAQRSLDSGEASKRSKKNS